LSKKGFSMVLILCLGAGSLAMAQMMNRPAGQGNSLARLQRAIQQSGAPALTTEQQNQLQTLIQNYRSSQQSTDPNSAVQTARQNLENAVLRGDQNGANAAADALAGAMTANMTRRLEAQAAFEIQALTILQPQATALKQELGNSGLLGLLGSLAGGPGMRAGMGLSGR